MHRILPRHWFVEADVSKEATSSSKRDIEIDKDLKIADPPLKETR